MVRFAGPSKWRNPAMVEMFKKHAAVWNLPHETFRYAAGYAEVAGGSLMLLGWIPWDVAEGLCLCGMMLIVCVMTGASMTQILIGNGWKGMQNSVWFSSFVILAGILRVIEVPDLVTKPFPVFLCVMMLGIVTVGGTGVMYSGLSKADPEGKSLASIVNRVKDAINGEPHTFTPHEPLLGAEATNAP
eukprot:CAMPEP_0169119656 /NCGR_PEP_ID=MMETSP1015-20121227/31680_1 /TAXON_ID=342587 /ORGANISM="Karlodinium micrum, Strain CCMP2283" /LENGTH=186 /DNA_ID=CAMNT_0009182565 /DNA_START=172 /DNA_END=732 /DNA_ORIENTATION=-